MAGVSGEELIAGLDLSGGEVEVDDVAARGSYALSLDDLVDLAARTRAALRDGAEAVVITHGTDTMEETAFLLDLVHADERPVVVTGAQRPFDHPAPDGPANLIAAFAVARSPRARGLGALLVFDGHAWQAAGVRKMETLASGAFGSPGRGPSLRVTPGGVLPLARRPRRPSFDLERLSALPRVDVVATYLGADAALLDASVAAGARGVVLQALGAGNVPPGITDAVRRLTEGGVPVLVTSRVVAGPVAPLYAGGGGADLARAGAVFAADMSPWQARLLLSASLAVDAGDPLATVTRWLDLAPPG